MAIKIPRRYEDADVVVTKNPPDVGGDRWMGSWTIKAGSITIFLEKKYVKAIQKHARQDLLDETLAHEYLEAKIALDLARDHIDAGKPNPKRLFVSQLAEDFGGIAHEKTIKAMHPGMSENQYERLLDRELKDIGL